MSTSPPEQPTTLPTTIEDKQQADGVEPTPNKGAEGVVEGEQAEKQEERSVPAIEVQEPSKGASEDAVGAVRGDDAARPIEKNEGGSVSGDANSGEGAISASETQPTDNKEDSAQPAIAASLARPPTPSSRTSTPPLSSSTAGAKKFSSININKKFLSKTVAPTSGSPAGGSKLGLSSTSPVPIATTSRLLSTKLTTVPSKTSQSPLPPSSATSTPAASPWAKPAPIEPDSDIKAPAPTKARVLSSIQPVSMGSGQGIAVAKAAWRPVGQEGKRGVGLSRDFPTAKEVADGKRDAAAIAQAKAAHNQAIMQELNAFTQLDPNARHWEDDDDGDEVIDFGDGMVYPHHDPSVAEAPVSKSERFAEDFDRSWPRQRPAQVDMTPAASGLPRRPENDRDRVLFNATSNRLEMPSSRQQPPPQPAPTRLMPRPDQQRPAMGDRPLPPHLQSGDTGRALPPHMSSAPQPDSSAQSMRLPPSTRQPLPSSTGSVRQPWGSQRDDTRTLPPHMQPPPSSSDRQELPPQSAAFNNAQHPRPPPSQQPPNNQRRSFSQLQRPPPPHANPSVSPQATATVPVTSPSAQIPAKLPQVDDQTAEMHSAAEKARLRRLAEEQEREAAAERARRKAKELEERLGLKSGAVAAAATSSAPTEAPKPAQAPAVALQPPRAPSAGFTLAQRPQPPAQTASAERTTGGLPARPAETRPSGRDAESSWRTRVEPSIGEAEGKPVSAVPSRAAPRPEPSGIKGSASTPAATRQGSNLAPSSSRDLPPHHMSNRSPLPSSPSAALDVPPNVADALLPSPEPERGPKREQTFDNMLARIQAAMKEARTTPAVAAEVETLPDAVDTAQTSSEPVASTTTKTPTPPAPTFTLPEYFDVTQLEIPKSPPPAWRTYAVKIPKSDDKPRPTLPLPRIKAFENHRAVYPKGWLMSFEPPIEGLSQTGTSAFSRSELFLPVVKGSRFGKAVPMVSISPRVLEPFVKKDKKKAGEKDGAVTAASAAAVPGAADGESAADALLAGETVVSAPGEVLRRSQTQTQTQAQAQTQSQQSQDAKEAYRPTAKSQNTSPVHGRTLSRTPGSTAPPASSATQPASTGVQANRWSSEKLDAIAQPTPKPPASVQPVQSQSNAPKPKSPVKQSLAAKAEREGLFDDGVGIGNPAQREQRDRAMSDAKPGQGGVRFMVSSELEGDSLLDEVNKISLEMVGEGGDGRERAEGGSGDAPGTPSKAANSTRAGTSPNSSTWSNGPVRSTPHGSQHDLMKSMWEQTPAANTKDTNTANNTGRADQYISPLVGSTSNTDLGTPMYPSLNAPSSADPPAPQPLGPGGMKMPYSSQHQAFSPTGNAPPHAYARSQQYASSGAGAGSGTYSPDPHAYSRSPNGMAGMGVSAYGYGMANGAQAYGAQAYGAQAYGMHVPHQQQHGQQQQQQAVWSPSAFGAGYGYTTNSNANANAGTNKSSPAPAGDKSANAAAAAAFGGAGTGDRYATQQAGGYAYGSSASHAHPGHGRGHVAATSGPAYGANAYARQGITSPVHAGYGYYGTPGVGAVAGRGGVSGPAASGRFGGGGAGSGAAAAIAAGAGVPGGLATANGEYGYGAGGRQGNGSGNGNGNGQGNGAEGGYYGGLGGAGGYGYSGHGHGQGHGHGAIGSLQQQQQLLALQQAQIAQAQGQGQGAQGQGRGGSAGAGAGPGQRGKMWG